MFSGKFGELVERGGLITGRPRGFPELVFGVLVVAESAIGEREIVVRLAVFDARVSFFEPLERRFKIFCGLGEFPFAQYSDADGGVDARVAGISGERLVVEFHRVALTVVELFEPEAR